MAFPDAFKVDLLDAETYRLYQARPERLVDIVAAHPEAETVVVDEVQKVPDILDVVHGLIERNRGVRFALTGSSARNLRKAGTNLLGGRALKLTMPPFVARELGGRFSLNKALVSGMLPIVVGADDPRQRLAAYIDLYIREEIQQEGLVRNLGSFARFLEAMSFSHGTQLSVSDVARDCSVSRTTVEGYIGILKDLLIAAIIPIFAKRAKRELVSHGKFYFFDTGVWRAIRPKGPLDNPSEIDGAALEGLVYQHLRASLDLEGERDGLYFWRTRGGLEVDFVLYAEKRFWAIEVKNATRIHPSDLKGLCAFREDYPEATPILLYRGRERIVQNGITLVPVEEFLTSL
jgi:predicted AAA+ superfamily ATPase